MKLKLERFVRLFVKSYNLIHYFLQCARRVAGLNLISTVFRYLNIKRYLHYVLSHNSSDNVENNHYLRVGLNYLDRFGIDQFRFFLFRLLVRPLSTGRTQLRDSSTGSGRRDVSAVLHHFRLSFDFAIILKVA